MKHNQQRRRLLETFVATTPAAGAATVVPRKWLKPVINAVEVPLHAQTSPAVSMTCTLSIVTQGWDETFSEGDYPEYNRLYGSQAQLLSIRATIDTPVAGVGVQLNIEPTPGNDATVPLSDQDATTNDAGEALFTDTVYDHGDSTDGPEGDALEGFTVTFSTTGLPDCVMTFSFTTVTPP